MNAEQKPENTTPETPAAAVPSDIAQIMQLLKDYLLPIGVGLLIAIVIIVGYGMYKSNKSAKSEEAAAALMQARNLEDIQRVAKEYKKTPAGPAALLGLANNYLQSGQTPMAKTTYDQFITEYPQHIMVPSAELGKAYCIEAEGDFNSAITAFQEFVKNNPDYFMTPEAILSQGRCLEQLGRYDDAIIVYENFLAENPESRWIPHAKTAIQYVKKSRRAHEKGLDVPTAPLISTQPAVGFTNLPGTEAEVTEAPAAAETATTEAPAQPVSEEAPATDAAPAE